MTAIISRDAARAAGLKRYFTGELCRRGHVAERYVNGGTGSGACVECHITRQHGATKRPPRLRDPEKRRERVRDHSRAKRARVEGHAPPPLERDCPSRPADGLCDCCLRPPRKRGLVLDHDHVTGAFRGWICDGCNRGAGLADDADKLRTRADFLDVKLPWQ